MTIRSEFLENAWYCAAISTDIKQGEMFSRKLLKKRVLFYRTKDGEPVALRDRCPHRFIPLSEGELRDDQVVCKYHGLTFNQEGACTHNPIGNGHIPAAACVTRYPLLEKYGFVWIWMGEQEADPSKLPDWSELDNGPASGVGHTYMQLDGNYELIIDNVMDLSHIDHVHSEIISTCGKLSPLMPKPIEKDNTITTRWDWSQKPAMLIFNQFLPDPEGEARQYFTITWSAPANIQLTVAATQEPEGFENAISQYDLHTATPEDEYNTHYFFATRRNHLEDDEEFNKMKIQAMHDAFHEEDGPIVRAIQEEMGDDDYFSLNPVLLTSDASPVRVRKILQELIDKEREEKAPVTKLAFK